MLVVLEVLVVWCEFQVWCLVATVSDISSTNQLALSPDLSCTNTNSGDEVGFVL